MSSYHGFPWVTCGPSATLHLASVLLAPPQQKKSGVNPMVLLLLLSHFDILLATFPSVPLPSTLSTMLSYPVLPSSHTYSSSITKLLSLYPCSILVILSSSPWPPLTKKRQGSAQWAFHVFWGVCFCFCSLPVSTPSISLLWPVVLSWTLVTLPFFWLFFHGFPSPFFLVLQCDSVASNDVFG